jgi:hypothetical protein
MKQVEKDGGKSEIKRPRCRWEDNVIKWILKK